MHTHAGATVHTVQTGKNTAGNTFIKTFVDDAVIALCQTRALTPVTIKNNHFMIVHDYTD